MHCRYVHPHRVLLNPAAREAIERARLHDLIEAGECKRIRIEAGLSLNAIGRAIGTSAASILRWENGERIPRGDFALRYLALLDALAARQKAA